jgi:hypothetical protein
MSMSSAGPSIFNLSLPGSLKESSVLINSIETMLSHSLTVKTNGFADLSFVDFSCVNFPRIAQHYCELWPRKLHISQQAHHMQAMGDPDRQLQLEQQRRQPLHNYMCSKCGFYFPCKTSLKLHQMKRVLGSTRLMEGAAAASGGMEAMGAMGAMERAKSRSDENDANDENYENDGQEGVQKGKVSKQMKSQCDLFMFNSKYMCYERTLDEIISSIEESTRQEAEIEAGDKSKNEFLRMFDLVCVASVSPSQLKPVCKSPQLLRTEQAEQIEAELISSSSGVTLVNVSEQLLLRMRKEMLGINHQFIVDLDRWKHLQLLDSDQHGGDSTEAGSSSGSRAHQNKIHMKPHVNLSRPLLIRSKKLKRNNQTKPFYIPLVSNTCSIKNFSNILDKKIESDENKSIVTAAKKSSIKYKTNPIEVKNVNVDHSNSINPDILFVNSKIFESNSALYSQIPLNKQPYSGTSLINTSANSSILANASGMSRSFARSVSMPKLKPAGPLGRSTEMKLIEVKSETPTNYSLEVGEDSAEAILRGDGDGGDSEVRGQRMPKLRSISEMRRRDDQSTPSSTDMRLHLKPPSLKPARVKVLAKKSDLKPEAEAKREKVEPTMPVLYPTSKSSKLTPKLAAGGSPASLELSYESMPKLIPSSSNKRRSVEQDVAEGAAAMPTMPPLSDRFGVEKDYGLLVKQRHQSTSGSCFSLKCKFCSQVFKAEPLFLQHVVESHSIVLKQRLSRAKNNHLHSSLAKVNSVNKWIEDNLDGVSSKAQQSIFISTIPSMVSLF